MIFPRTSGILSKKVGSLFYKYRERNRPTESVMRLADRYGIKPEIAGKYPNGIQFLDLVFASSDIDGILEDGIKGIISEDQLTDKQHADVLATLERLHKALIDKTRQ